MDYVLNTRSSQQAAYLNRELEGEGFVPVCVPVITVSPTYEISMLRSLEDYMSPSGLQGDPLGSCPIISQGSWLFVTSANGLRYFMMGLQKMGAAHLAHRFNLGVVGQQTAEVARELGLSIAYLSPFPEVAVMAEDLVRLIDDGEIWCESAVVATRLGSKSVIARALECRGKAVREIPVYSSERSILSVQEIERLRKFIEASTIYTHAIAVMSGETLSFLSEHVRELQCESVSFSYSERLRSLPLVVVGKNTAEQAKAQGFERIITPSSAKVDSMARALKDYFSK